MIWQLRHLKPVENLYGVCIHDIRAGVRDVTFTIHHLSIELFILVVPSRGLPFITNELSMCGMGEYMLLQRGATYTIDKQSGVIRKYVDQDLAAQYLPTAATLDDPFNTIKETVHGLLSDGLDRVATKAKAKGLTLIAPISGGIDSTLVSGLLRARGHDPILYTFGWTKGDETEDQLAAYENAKGLDALHDLDVIDLSDKEVIDFALSLLPVFRKRVPIPMPRPLWVTVFLRYLATEWLKDKYQLKGVCSITGDSGGQMVKPLQMTKPERIKYRMWDTVSSDPAVKDRLAQMQHIARIHRVDGGSAYATTELTWETLHHVDNHNYYSPFHDRNYLTYGMKLRPENAYASPLVGCSSGKHVLRAILRDIAPTSLWNGKKLAFENIFSKWDASGFTQARGGVTLPRMGADKYKDIGYKD